MTRSRALVALVAVLTMVTAESLRMSGPLLDRVAGDVGVLAAVVAGLVGFGLAALLGPLVAVVGARRAALSTVAALVVLRLLAQLAPGVLVGLSMAAVALAALVLVVRQAAFPSTGVVAAVAGVVVGGAVDVGLRASLSTWDAVWRPGLAGWLVAVAECAVLVWVLRAARPYLHDDPAPARRIVLLGGYLALSLVTVGSPGFVAARSGLSLGYASAVLLVGALFTVEVLSRCGLPGGSGRSRLGSGAVAAALLVAGVIGAVLVSGVPAALGVLLAQLGAALVVARGVAADAVPGDAHPDHDRGEEAGHTAVIDASDASGTTGTDSTDASGTTDATDGSPERPDDVRPARVPRHSARGLGLAAFGSGMAVAVTVLLTLPYRGTPLPLTQQLVPVGLALLLAAAGLRVRVPSLSALGVRTEVAGRPEAAGNVGPLRRRTGPGPRHLAVDERAARRGRLAPLAAVPAALLLVPVAMLATTPAPAAGPEEPAADSFRLVSWNIRYARTPEGGVDPERIASTVRSEDADVVLLQEVGRGRLSGGTLDTAEWLSRRLGMPYVYRSPAGGDVGLLVLSRLRMRPADTSAADANSSRPSHVVVTVELPSGRTVDLHNVHLTERSGATELDRLTAALDAADPVVLAGDLGATPRSDIIAALRAAGMVSAQDSAGRAPLPTTPTEHPRHRVDWVFGTSDLFFGDVARPDVRTSDHFPLAVTVHVG